MAKTATKFELDYRRSQGWWDGQSDRERCKRAPWEQIGRSETPHPFDQVYGRAYWAGRRNERHPVSGLPM